MSSAPQLAALREAYADAEEWMLEGVCASLDGLRGDRAGVRETLGSFLGELDGETMETLADAWAPRARDRRQDESARLGVRARARLATTTLAPSPVDSHEHTVYAYDDSHRPVGCPRFYLSPGKARPAYADGSSAKTSRTP